MRLARLPSAQSAAATQGTHTFSVTSQTCPRATHCLSDWHGSWATHALSMHRSCAPAQWLATRHGTHAEVWGSHTPPTTLQSASAVQPPGVASVVVSVSASGRSVTSDMSGESTSSTTSVGSSTASLPHATSRLTENSNTHPRKGNVMASSSTWWTRGGETVPARSETGRGSDSAP